MKTTAKAHYRRRRPWTLSNNRLEPRQWDSEQQRIRLRLVCEQGTLRNRARHDIDFELSLRELAELVGHVARQVTDKEALRPLADVMAMMICGGPSNRPALFWRWSEDTDT